MSSPEEDYDNENGSQSLKKRRVQRACDICRRKKVRCDGGQMPGNRCSNCVTYNHECTYVEAAKKRGPPKGYVESLENRLQKMEALLHKLCPDADFTAELGGALEKEPWYTDRGDKASSLASAATSPIPPSATEPEDLAPSDDEIISQRDLIRNIKQMDLSSNQHMRFFGKSSSVMFIQTAIEAKHEYAGVDYPKRREEGWRPILPSRRPQFWGVHPWIVGALHHEKQQLKFPERDLLDTLVDLFFARINCFQPLLHGPTFKESIQEGLHEQDEGFGSVLLLVCAAASRFSDDPRVLLEGSDDSHSSGWEWFRQVHLVRKSLLAPPRLYDLQICALTAIFLQSTSAPQACWTVIGVGIRLAQDVGAHRRKVYHQTSYVEQELWKRAFWVLVSMDRGMSMSLGRPCAIQDEDFDVELPVECDDEYWVVKDNPNPEKNHIKVVEFKQPPDKPSKITFFNCFLRLNQILAFALRTIYSINKSKALLGFVGTQWEQHIVAELDSALNKWIDSVPDHLRWDPHREDMLFLNQSALLYAHYYQLQIAVHRPFIPSPRKPSPLAFPSLAICTNAARSCTHVLDVPYRRSHTVLHASMVALFTSGIVLLLNIWGGKRSGLSTDPMKEMAEVHNCMRMLKALEPKWHTAGRLWDVLYELASMGDLPLPQASPSPNNKRDRDSESPIESPQMPPTPASMTPPLSESIFAGPGRSLSQQRQRQQSQQSPTRTIHARQQAAISPTHQASQSSRKPPPLSHKPVVTAPIVQFGDVPPPTASGIASIENYGLPMYTADLGRMPLHPGSTTDPSLNLNWRDPGTLAGAVPMTATAAASVVPTTHYPSPSDTQPKMPSMFGMSTTTATSSIHNPPPAPPTDPSSYDQVMSAFAGTTFGANLDGYSNVLEANAGSPGPAMMPMGAAALGLGTMGMGMEDFTDADTLAMWSNAPPGFEWDDWGTFISQGLGPQPSGSA